MKRRGVIAALALLGACSEQPQALPQPCPDLAAGCQYGALRVVTDHAPQTMRPFLLRVQLADADAVDVSFAMAGMYMGLNRYRMVAKEGGWWEAEVTLPVCVSARADWTMQIDAHGRFGRDQRYLIGFESTRGAL